MLILHLLYHPPAEYIAPIVDEIQHRRVVLLLNDDRLRDVVELFEHFDIAECRGDSAHIGPELLKHGFKTATDRRSEAIERALQDAGLKTANNGPNFPCVISP